MAIKNNNLVTKKRVRNPEATRAAILTAARTVLSEDGPEGLSVSRVANLAGVNRGTAYQHFATRDDLLHATAEWVSDQLMGQGFLASKQSSDGTVTLPSDGQSLFEAVERMVKFAMENPELGRIWLFDMLSSKNSGDHFFSHYKQSVDVFAESSDSKDDIDSEVLAMILLSGIFMWPVWASAQAKSTRERKKMASRFTREFLRLSLHGILKPQKYPKLVAMLREGESYYFK
ncbi:TetR/AcrR family transcriptional regulator [Spongiibacter sp. KMU-158]|uniref:TetR/AcrR family transcriptional regulator n=1 Tax=Spongiibacter pelagi TaxID=2760804 RepID=A0A927C5E8_9GAMM|nr:TetR/AcrR family transcriptional regulator [Spongiibacter pelagi]MBD2860247.1 TetR/AcrR family transcriptional regulator [Spongiibacter pelagi]